MLFVSRSVGSRSNTALIVEVSISESRCFSFQGSSVGGGNVVAVRVSISESRCFSFQGPAERFLWNGYQGKFQSRNRDAFRFKRHCKSWLKSDLTRFNLGIEMLFVSREHRSPAPQCRQHSFNLGIEMLFVSSSCRAVGYYKSNLKVSISESRCFSFQVHPRR